MKISREITYETPPKKGLALDELNKMLLVWQNKLEMSDWKLDIKIVDFKNKNNYRQSGDFIADPDNNTATILMTWDPWRGDEEYTLVHELLHILVYDYDKYSENFVLKNHGTNAEEYGIYMNKLENTVHQLTRILVGRSDR